jgi:2-hydroxy-3-keto-5-methylthiopentenyl-1-phosphate phosphatase
LRRLRHLQDARGQPVAGRAWPIAFIGEGQSDRYGALYSDVVFAKDALVQICEQDAVPFVRWETFDDVRSALETMDEVPGPVGGALCPGWRKA